MLRRILLASAGAMALMGPALAADLPLAPPPPPIPIFTWTGVYIGAQVGYAWGNDHADLFQTIAVPGAAFVAFGQTFGTTPQGVIGGGHVGYNLQINQWVVGIEGTVDGTSLKKTVFLPFFGVNETTRSEVQGSIRGRIGWAFDRFLVYATGGAVFGGITNTYSAPLFFGPFPLSNSFATTKVGWTVGAGLEYAITNNWSVRAEYRYSDFGHVTDHPFAAIAAAPPATFFSSRHHLTQNQVQVGFSYKFDFLPPPAPVVAKY